MKLGVAFGALAFASAVPAQSAIQVVSEGAISPGVQLEQFGLPSVDYGETLAYRLEYTGGTLANGLFQIPYTSRESFKYPYGVFFELFYLAVHFNGLTEGSFEKNDRFAYIHQQPGAITLTIANPAFSLAGCIDAPASLFPMTPCAINYVTPFPRIFATFAGDDPVRYRVVYGDVAAVPEPATWATLVTGLGFVGWATRSSRRRSRRLSGGSAIAQLT